MGNQQPSALSETAREVKVQRLDGSPHYVGEGIVRTGVKASDYLVDEVFFVDLPNATEREAVFKVQLNKLNRRADHKRPVEDFDITEIVKSTVEFSGSEIEQALVSALHDAFEAKEELSTDKIVKAARETYPLARTMKEQIDGLRMWANGRARYATPKEDGEVGETEGAQGTNGDRLEL